MRKQLIFIIIVAALAAAIFCFIGCADFSENGTPDVGVEYFTVTYVDGDKVVYERQIARNGYADNPEMHPKAHYTFDCWYRGGVPYDFRPVTENLTLTAKWKPVEYTVDFKCDGVRIAQRKYTVENTDVEPPPITEKKGYTARWESFILNGGNITVNAIYTAINYKINFYADGGLLQTVTYTIEDETVTEPGVPGKQYYTGAWEEYSLDLQDKDVHAVYEPITYRASFYADGQFVAYREYDAEHAEITEPAIPQKEHYTAEWESYSLPQGDGNVRINAVYTPIEYTVTFTDGAGFSQTRTYTAENREINEPDVPTIEHYSGAWSTYELDFENITVTAEYSPITYTVEFYVDGELIARRFYDIENRAVAEPPVPAKKGYTSGWSPYRLEGGNIRVDAVYEKIPDPEATPQLLFTLSGDGKSYIVTGVGEGFAGGRLVIPSRCEELPVTEIADNAFSGNDKITALYICNGITTIGGLAFYACANLSEIDFPDTLETIGNTAFSSVAIKELNLPPNLKTIGERAFQNCAQIENLVVPDSVEEIGNRAFSQCTSIKTIFIGKGVRKIGVGAFKICSSAESMTFADPENWVRVFSADSPDVTEDMTKLFADPAETARILCSQENNDYYYEKRQ